jgi:hypothetical protein
MAHSKFESLLKRDKCGEWSECKQVCDEVQLATVRVPKHGLSWLGHTMEESSTDVSAQKYCYHLLGE